MFSVLICRSARIVHLFLRNPLVRNGMGILTLWPRHVCRTHHDSCGHPPVHHRPPIHPIYAHRCTDAYVCIHTLIQYIMLYVYYIYTHNNIIYIYIYIRDIIYIYIDIDIDIDICVCIFFIFNQPPQQKSVYHSYPCLHVH